MTILPDSPLHPFKHLGNRKGVALITTLMVVSLVVATVVEFNRTAIADIEVSKNFSNENKILYIAISAVHAIRDLLKIEGAYSKSDSLLEEWAKGKAYFDSASAMLDEGKVEGIVQDENGKIGVNSLVGGNGQFEEVQKGIWERLLKQPIFGLTDDQVNTIVHGVKDWIDQDDEVTGIFGAEDTLYAPKGYRCKNGPLQTLEEMLLINGVTKEVFYGDSAYNKQGIYPYFTVHGGPGININTAPLPILAALHQEMTGDMVMEMDKFRMDEGNKIMLANKNWYRRVLPLGVTFPESVLTISSNAFSVHIRATLGESVKEIKAVLSRSDEAAFLVYWAEM